MRLKDSRRGELATTLAVISLLIISFGLVVGPSALNTTKQLLGKAAGPGGSLTIGYSAAPEPACSPKILSTPSGSGNPECKILVRDVYSGQGSDTKSYVEYGSTLQVKPMSSPDQSGKVNFEVKGSLCMSNRVNSANIVGTVYVREMYTSPPPPRPNQGPDGTETTISSYGGAGVCNGAGLAGVSADGNIQRFAGPSTQNEKVWGRYYDDSSMNNFRFYFSRKPEDLCRGLYLHFKSGTMVGGTYADTVNLAKLPINNVNCTSPTPTLPITGGQPTITVTPTVTVTPTSTPTSTPTPTLPPTITLPPPPRVLQCGQECNGPVDLRCAAPSVCTAIPGISGKYKCSKYPPVISCGPTVTPTVTPTKTPTLTPTRPPTPTITPTPVKNASCPYKSVAYLFTEEQYRNFDPNSAGPPDTLNIKSSDYPTWALMNRQQRDKWGKTPPRSGIPFSFFYFNNPDPSNLYFNQPQSDGKRYFTTDNLNPSSYSPNGTSDVQLFYDKSKYEISSILGYKGCFDYNTGTATGCPNPSEVNPAFDTQKDKIGDFKMRCNVNLAYWWVLKAKPGKCEKKQADIALVVDTSTSMSIPVGGPNGVKKIDSVKAALKSFVNQLNLGYYQVAIITFDRANNTKLVQNFTSNINTLNTKIGSLQSGDPADSSLRGTCINKGLHSAVNLLNSIYPPRRKASAKPVTVLFSDGLPDCPAGDPDSNNVQIVKWEAENLKTLGSTNFSIGFGTNVSNSLDPSGQFAQLLRYISGKLGVTDGEPAAQKAKDNTYFFNTANSNDLSRFYSEVSKVIACQPTGAMVKGVTTERQVNIPLAEGVTTGAENSDLSTQDQPAVQGVSTSVNQGQENTNFGAGARGGTEYTSENSNNAMEGDLNGDGVVNALDQSLRLSR